VNLYLLPFFKCASYGKFYSVKKGWENMPIIVAKCSHNLFCNFDSINEKVENVCSS
jgi:hypothetical protein